VLCSGRPGFVDARAIGIVGQVRDGDNPTSLILAEILLGLDFVFLGGESQQFLESSLTFQIWLMERLDMIATPTNANYGPSNFPSWAILKTKCQIESNWVTFFGQEIQYLNSLEMLLVEVPTSFIAISGIRSYLLGWLKEGNFL